MIYASAIKNFAPRPRVRTADWVVDWINTHTGRPYDDRAYPHITAPGGPCDAHDDPRVQIIVLQWASRLGKTFYGQCCTLFRGDTNPCPMMFASQSEKLALEVVDRTHTMYANCDPLKPQLRPEHRRKAGQVDFDACRMHVAWARSVTTLADKAVKWGHANEVDKWEHTATSSEADPLKLFTDRGKEFPNRKFLIESTPAVKGRSRVERLRLQGTNCLYWVPCPHCGVYQTLEFGEKGKPGGIQWPETRSRGDRDRVLKEAHYVCLHCEGKIENRHRSMMMRSGVWAPEGCGVDSEGVVDELLRRQNLPPADDPDRDRLTEAWDGWENARWITGRPVRNGRNASYQLSSLYALSLDWGDIAVEYLDSVKKPQLLRNFWNQWLAKTWEIASQTQTWEELGQRIIVRIPHGVVPEGFSIVTAGIDKQIDHYVYLAEAWGPERRSHVLDYGTVDDIEDLWSQVIECKWPHADGGQPLKTAITLFDSGFRPKGVYDFCRKAQSHKLLVVPCKGSNVSLGTEFKRAKLGKETSAPGFKIVHVDTISTQDWLESQLHVLKPGEPGSTSLFDASIEDHQDYLEQMLNEAVVSTVDNKNYDREVWQRLDESTPNDYRDCKRYADVGVLVATRGRPIKLRQPAAVVAKRKAGQPQPAWPLSHQLLDRPGGWIP